MNLIQAKTGSAALTTAVSLAQLLEQLDRSAKRIDGEQYRLVAGRLAAALQELGPGAPLQALLEASPSATEVYENMNYQHAGLCRSPLDAALAAEVETGNVIAQARRTTPARR